MARPVVLSNGSMHVGINLYGMVHDFYYPYVGLENHATANNMRWRIGVWSAGNFSWLDEPGWQFEHNFEEGALVERTKTHNPSLGVTLELHGCVDYDQDAFLRSIRVTNERDEDREIRLFLHQVMRISNSLNGDTAQYLPDEPAILHYKGSRVFLFGAEDKAGVPFKQYSVGVYGIEGKEGTFRDAEDGLLSGNTVEHGSVDSVIGFNLDLGAKASTVVTYWVAAGFDYNSALTVFKKVRTDGIPERLAKTAEHWRRWLRPANNFSQGIEPSLRQPFEKSLLVLKAHIDKRGAVIAATDTTMRNYSRDAYAYCWPRDGAFALWPLLRLGYFKEVQNFFEFARRGLQPEGFLMHKYLADGSIGSSWHPYLAAGRRIPPIQEDETAIVIFLFGQYYQITEDRETLRQFYDSLIRPAANFMAGYIDEVTKLPHATYDIWEEKLLTTTYTTAITYAALQAAARMAEAMGRQYEAVQWQAVADDIHIAAQTWLFNKDKNYFYKGFIRRPGLSGELETTYDTTIDTSSFYGAFMFGLFDLKSEAVTRSYETLKATFGLVDNAVVPLPRYEHDPYRRADPNSQGNPWFITTLWLAQYYLETNQLERAKTTIHWVREQMLPTGVLSEQLDPHSHHFLSVAPLTWSQAEFLNSVIDLVSEPVKH